jgi:predicted adenine nucleotide alpha hydrolase (AANH) superfamily ATPase
VKCIAALREEGIEIVLFWYNPNIHPFTEYKSRRDALFQYAASLGLELIGRDEYGLRAFTARLYRGTDGEDGPGTGDPEDGPGAEDPAEFGKRCGPCYRMRLERTARTAREGGFDAFSTTLLVSPYQNHELLRESAEASAAREGAPFLYRDFRPRFREGRAEARRLGLYMQKYCGCIFSEEERYRRPGAP